MQRKPGYEWLILCVFAVVLVVQLWASIRQLSATSDEIVHLHAGYRHLQCGDFAWNAEHPPLAKMVAAIPLRLMRIHDPIDGGCGYPIFLYADLKLGHDFLFANPESVLFYARAAISIFSVALLFIVWHATRKVFGFGPAIIAATLLVFEPTILAHGALVTTDIPVAFGFCASVFSLYAYFAKRTWLRLVIAGVAIGLALAIKFSSILLIPIVSALALADVFLRRNSSNSMTRLGGNVLAVCAMFIVAVGVLWTCYGWRYDARPDNTEDTTWIRIRGQQVHGTVGTYVLPEFEKLNLLPQAYLVGLRDQLHQAENGSPSFVLGHLYRSGQWFYFPVAAVVKFSAVVLLLSLAAFGASPLWRKHVRELVFLAVPCLIYMAFSMRSQLAIGVRHIAPVLPFLIIFASAGTWAIIRHRQWLRVALSAILVFHALSSLHAYPNYLSYSNEFWGGPANTYKYLADSNADWGQSLKQARTYLEHHAHSNCWIIRPYYVANSDYSIPCGETSEPVLTPPPVHYHGMLIVSSSVVAGLDRQIGGPVAGSVFRNLRPKESIGGSALLVYEGDFDLGLIAARADLEQAKEALGRGDFDRGAAYAEAAGALDPNNAAIQTALCSVHLRSNHDQAETDCNAALRLSSKDPTVSATDIAGLKRFMERNGLKIRAGLADTSSRLPN